MIPFPHILTEPTRNDHKMRVVSDTKIKPGNVLYCVTSKTNYLIEFVTELRPARGDWSAYPNHPTYYECLASTFIQKEIDFPDQKPPESYAPKQSQVFPLRPFPAA
jgi:hypothetical protein